MRVLTILGARPQFIKAAATSSAFVKAQGMNEVIVHTGQHHDAAMSDIFFDELGIPAPAHHLGIAGGGHGEMTGRMLAALETVIEAEAPDWVMVYGDTNSTLAGALAAAKLHVPVAHVEAGLRSFNRRMPEEVNRVLTDHCAELLLTPTATATANLLREGLPEARITEVGDVMYDTVLMFGDLARQRGSGATAHGFDPGGYVLATIHRQENTDDERRLGAIVEGLAAVATRVPVLLPLHPRTRKQIATFGLEERLGDIRIVEPLGYLEMVGLQRDAAVIATDSGGVQKEAFFHSVPCVTMRDETEWVELVEAGWNRLVPPLDREVIAETVLASVGSTGAAISPYGKGDAAEQIVMRLASSARAGG
ncbi:MAG: non-hydrolyzing UDP-N-acetylglucosamine 2-epimerase [Bradyrhizobium sp.]|uniref:non-hydrolyzing UDP-N-acetylglucosamine 2-epimerase n=1 Tax=Bradyrhizobium sp. TaxID=376 RepID=UPI003D0B9DB7